MTIANHCLIVACLLPLLLLLLRANQFAGVALCLSSVPQAS